MNEDAGFYCNRKALTKTERDNYSQLTAEIIGAKADTYELPDGYAFRLHDKVSLPDVAKWITYERRCCPFFDFRVDIARDNGPIWLRLRGREGVKAFIRAEFAVPQP